MAAVAETIGKRFQDLVVGPDTVRWSFDPAPENDASFEVGHRPFLFGPLGDGQDNIGERGGLGEEQVGDDEKVEIGKAIDERNRSGRRDDDIRAHHKQALDASGGAERVQQFASRKAGFWQLGWVDSPYRRDFGAMAGIVESAVARELVGLLAVLAAALAIALSRQCGVAAKRLARLAERQDEIDEGQNVVRRPGSAAPVRVQ